MIILATIGTLIGAVLGLRFKVLVLVPVMVFALAIVAVDGIARGDSVWQLVAAMVVVATSVQLGFLGGSAVSAWRAAGHGGISVPTSARVSGSIQ